jgi:hypothetical protein
MSTTPKPHQPESARLNETHFLDMVRAITASIQQDPSIREAMPRQQEQLQTQATAVVDNELIGQVNRSSENDWQTKPAHYAAIIDELLQRGLIKPDGPAKN